MARPIKQGLDYFPFDVDFFQDLKIRKIIRSNGQCSPAVLICVLALIYKENGYYINWDEDTAFVVSEMLNSDEETISNVVSKAIYVGFFNEEIHNKFNILTSKAIQERYVLIVKSSKLKRDGIENKYNLIGVNTEETRVNTEETAESTEETPKSTEESTQSKVKERKEKKRKENNTFTNVNILENKFEKNDKMETNLNNSSGENKKEKVASKRKTFVSPTIDEIVDYCNERKNNINATTFWNFYESKGWLVGKTKMKDWKAAIRTWESKEKTNKSQSFSTSNCIRERRASELLGGQN